MVHGIAWLRVNAADGWQMCGGKWHSAVSGQSWLRDKRGNISGFTGCAKNEKGGFAFLPRTFLARLILLIF
jgi:hypothetical protein